MLLVYVHCGPVVDFFIITKQTSLHPFDFRNLFHLLVSLHVPTTLQCVLVQYDPSLSFNGLPLQLDYPDTIGYFSFMYVNGFPCDQDGRQVQPEHR